MKKVLVFGDTMLDIYNFGEVKRISPEAPVPILDHKECKIVLGGACNVASNIKSLSKEDEQISVHYCGWVSPMVSDLLSEKEIANKEINCKDEDVLLKTRFVSNNHQILRVDTNKNYKEKFKLDWSFLKDYDLIVISDYDKSTITTQTISDIVKNSTCKILFDVKKWNKLLWIDLSSDRFVFKCNWLEIEEVWADEKLQSYFKSLANVVVTYGKKGFTVFPKKESFGGVSVSHVSDVVGAGDTFLAGMAVYYLETGEFNIIDMANFGNFCAAEKVRHFGTRSVKRKDVEELKNEVSRK